MHLVVPMAGLGQRFRDEGYALPKPLIDVSAVPMVVRAVRDLPSCERMTFLVHPDHVREQAIDRRLNEFFPKANVIATPGLTQGQACTVRLASDVVEDGEEVLIAACDNSHVYDAGRFAALRADPSIDAIIWTYRHDPRVLVRPTAHGWVQFVAGTLRVPSGRRDMDQLSWREFNGVQVRAQR
jgi:NDP-sugar pyrophosphorylase family protein